MIMTLKKKLRNFLLLLWSLLLLPVFLQAQLVRNIPAEPEISDTLLIIFDANEGNKALKDYKGNVYFHAGLITSASKDGSDWKYAVGNWGQPDARVKMLPMGAGLYRASIPIKTFFDINDDLPLKQLALVFRNEDGSLAAKTADEKDFYINFKGYQPAISEQPGTRSSIKRYLGQQVENNILFIKTDQGDFSFRPFADSIIEVMFHPGGFTQFDSSHAVIMKPGEIETLLTETPNALMFDLPGMQVFIHKNPLEIRFLSNGQALLNEEAGFFTSNTGVGYRFVASQGERFYGSGGRASGINLRGKKLGLYNRPQYGYEIGATDLNYTIPLLLSSKKYMIFFDNPQKGQIDVDSEHKGVVTFSAIGGPQKFYLIHGENPNSILQQYSRLTGKQQLPPRWAFGNLQSRMAYRTQAETDSIVKLMLKNDFPIDAVILDFYWFGDSILGHLGRLDWFKPSWPEPEKMIADFKKSGIQTITISEPYIIDTLENFGIAAELGLLATDSLGKVYVDKQFYFGDGSLIDIFKPEAADWLWSKYKKQFEQGVAGLWGDLGEPESHPSDLYHVAGKADEVHNIYGHYWAKSIYDRFRRDYPDRRLFFLARSGYAGSQRFGMIPWSGDVSRSWGGLQAQLPAMLNMSMSGVPYMHSDAGGFAMGQKDDELYTRWLQFAAFTPILRPHGSGIPSEPVYFNDTTQRIVRHFMKLRYQLLPYIYTQAWKTAETGTPIVVPVFYYYPDDERFKSHYESYFFGRDMLVAPVTSAGIKNMTVELPQGEWFHFWSKEAFRGGKSVQVNTALESIPLFVRAGSIIPMVDAVTSTAFYSSKKLYLKTYLPALTGELKGKIYEDDGETYESYQKGAYELISLDGSKDAAGKIAIRLRKSGDGYAGMPELRMLEFELIGKQKIVTEININDLTLQPLDLQTEDISEIGFWENTSGNTSFRFLWAGEAIDITIE
jgi:oligosaccharide 4-alpha-D-glucosyltransferase